MGHPEFEGGHDCWAVGRTVDPSLVRKAWEWTESPGERAESTESQGPGKGKGRELE